MASRQPQGKAGTVQHALVAETRPTVKIGWLEGCTGISLTADSEQGVDRVEGAFAAAVSLGRC